MEVRFQIINYQPSQFLFLHIWCHPSCCDLMSSNNAWRLTFQMKCCNTLAAHIYILVSGIFYLARLHFYMCRWFSMTFSELLDATGYLVTTWWNTLVIYSFIFFGTSIQSFMISNMPQGRNTKLIPCASTHENQPTWKYWDFECKVVNNIAAVWSGVSPLTSSWNINCFGIAVIILFSLGISSFAETLVLDRYILHTARCKANWPVVSDLTFGSKPYCSNHSSARHLANAHAKCTNGSLSSSDGSGTTSFLSHPSSIHFITHFWNCRIFDFAPGQSLQFINVSTRSWCFGHSTVASQNGVHGCLVVFLGFGFAVGSIAFAIVGKWSGNLGDAVWLSKLIFKQL